jgi:SAM-dependent methyltransferase
MMSIEFYNNNSKEFFDSTVNADMSELYGEFLKHVKHGGKILDAGCGSGRDTLYFMKNGYSVVAFDASEEMVRLGSEYTGKQVLKMRLQELNFEDEFDGIWACASLLHVPKSEIDDVLKRVVASLKVDGILFVSFKYGDGETIRGGRLFNSYNEETLRIILDRNDEIKTLKLWKTKDVRPTRDDEFWISALCMKI